MVDAALWKLLGFILALYLLFVFPLVHALERQEEIGWQLAVDEVQVFLDSLRYRGYVDREMLEGFKRRLDMTGGHYRIRLEHLHQQYVPVYGDPTDPSTFTGDYERVEEAFFMTDIEEKLYPATGPAETYPFSVGDHLVLCVENRSTSLADALKGMLYGQRQVGARAIIQVSGMVHNAD